MIDPRVRTTIPSSNEERLVFPFHLQSKAYDVTPFITSPHAERMRLEEVKLVLTEIQDAQKPFISKEARATIFFATFIVIMASTLLALLFTVGAKDVSFMYKALGVAGVLILLAIIKYQRHLNRNTRQVREAVQAVLDNYNKIFAGKGQHWRIPPQFPLWVELWEGIRKNVDNESTYTNMKPVKLGNNNGPYEHLLATSAESMI